MIHIDGSDGGGGVLRTALGLSLATGDPVRIENVRGSRPTPGLKPQHRACVEAARLVGDAAVTGAEQGSETVTFEPGSGTPTESERADTDPRPREHAVDVGTAGSATLVASTVLPAALTTDRTVRLRIAGGTDVAWSPPADYFGGVTLACLRAHGLAAALDVPERGFYPAGGGVVRLTLGPSTLAPLELDGEATIERTRVSAVATTDLLDADVADRLARETGATLEESTDVTVASRAARYADAPSTDASVVVRAEGHVGSSDQHPDRPQRPIPLAGFSALGEADTPAEAVADEAVEAFREWRRGPGAVDRHLGDQLVPYLALAGGAVRIPEVTDHVENAVMVADAFGFDVRIDEAAAPGDGAVVRKIEEH
ncbi:RNA 3'-terminal phosphate cyclase [Halorubrum gandharaense]